MNSNIDFVQFTDVNFVPLMETITSQNIVPKKDNSLFMFIVVFAIVIIVSVIVFLLLKKDEVETDDLEMKEFGESVL